MNLKALLLIGLLALAGAQGAVAASSINVAAWQALPVLENGRVMPLDSYARQILLSFSGRSSLGREGAAQWLTRVFFTPEETRDDRIFLINHPEVFEALGLPLQARTRCSYGQLEPTLAELTRLARAAMRVDQEVRTPVDNEIIRLFRNLDLYRRLMQGFEFALPKSEFALQNIALARELDLPTGVALTLLDLDARSDRLSKLAADVRDGKLGASDMRADEVRKLSMSVRLLGRARTGLPPAMIPRVAAGGDSVWVSAWDARGLKAAHAELGGELDHLRSLASAFREGRQALFDRAARDFQESITQRIDDPGLQVTLGREVTFNRVDPFYRSELLYGLAFLAALLSLATRHGRWIYGAALVLAGLALVPHTYGLWARMVIMGRPPVTNLYATFLFVGWTCALLGLVMEWLQRNRLGLITASASGLALLLTAGRFSEDGDTMGVMVAVLDSNFWLATHVVCISMGYAGCCASGLIGHIYLIQAWRRAPSDPVLLDTYRAMYGLQAFGLLFSFVGTMLGGVWADQSWGRFWGWDPKENGALVIVLWSAILFHARMGKMLDNRGFAAGTVLGVITVLLAWMGVNLLGVGLHSYGFTSGIARGLCTVCLIEVAFVAVTAPFVRRAPGEPRL